MQTSYSKVPSPYTSMNPMNLTTTTATTSPDSLAFSIVWSPLPPITWIFPFIGHTGIADSHGIVSDFQGPYTVGDRGHMAFGAPTRALLIRTAVGGAAGNSNVNPKQSGIPSSRYHYGDDDDDNSACHAAARARWDEAIQEANQEYRGRMHNIFCDNCHSHVAYALNRAAVKDYGVEKWDMVKIALLVFVRGRFLSWNAVLQTFGPFMIFLFLILFFSFRGGK